MKRRKREKLCLFKDVHGLKKTVDSTLYSRQLLNKGNWGKFPADHVLSKAFDRHSEDLHAVYQSILQENVGVDDDSFLEVVNGCPVYHILLTMLDKTVQSHKKTMLRSSYTAVELDSLGKKTTLGVRATFKQVRRSLLATFPYKLLGTKTNWDSFLVKIKYLMQQGYLGALPITTLMAGIKQSEIPWLRGLKYNGHRLRILAKILRWMVKWSFTYIASFWLMTEGNSGIVFVDRRFNRRLVNQAYNSMIRSGKLILDDSREFPVQARLKFVAKKDGLRPLTIVESTNIGTDNVAIVDVQRFLQSLINKFCWVSTHPGRLTDVVSILQKYSTLKRANKISKIYFVKVDIVDAFGSVLIEKLRSILQSLFLSIIPEDRRIKKCVFKKTDEINGFFKKYVEYQFQGEPFRPPKGFFPCKEEVVDVRPMLVFLDALMKGVGAKFNKHNHSFSRGIGQGIKTSSLFSELYYRHMFECHLTKFMVGDTDRLFRYADDILYLTPDQERARLFLSRMEAGFPDYNCRINPTKTESNISTPTLTRVKYYGAEICTETLTLTPSMKLKRNCMTSTKYDRRTKQFKLLKTEEVLENFGKMYGTKNEPWFMDLRVNGKEKVLKNIEYSSKYLAKKLLNTRLRNRGNFNPRRILKTVRRYTKGIVKSCRRIFAKRCPTRGKGVLDAEIELAVYRGSLCVFAARKDYKRVVLGIRNLMEERNAVLKSKRVLAQSNQ